MIHHVILIVLSIHTAIVAEFTKIDAFKGVRASMQRQHMGVSKRFVAFGARIFVDRRMGVHVHSKISFAVKRFLALWTLKWRDIIMLVHMANE